MTVVLAHDATHDNIGHLPAGQALGYTTGTAKIAWTAADWAAHPGAVRICQDGGSDVTADLLDVERYAATNADAAAWVPEAQAAWRAGKRPGQRWPGIYTSASNITPLANTFVAAKITNVPLVVARWDNNETADAAAVLAASGPWPTVGFQYINGIYYDSDVLSAAWLANVSRAPRPAAYHVTVTPPGWWQGQLRVTGKGTDGEPWHTTTGNGRSWAAPARGA